MRLHRHQGERGAVLILSLFFLLLLTIVATTTTQTSTLQLQMAGNDQAKVEAQQRVMAVIDGIMDDTDNTPIVGAIGYKVCKTGDADNTCDETLIALSSGVTTVPTGATLTFHVLRKGPLTAGAPVMSENAASSASAFNVARYEIIAEYDGSAARLGSSSIVQGMLVKIPSQAN
jgi:hypothetical protein